MSISGETEHGGTKTPNLQKSFINREPFETCHIGAADWMHEWGALACVSTCQFYSVPLSSYSVLIFYGLHLPLFSKMNQKPNRRHLHHLPFDVLEIIFNLLDCPRHRATPFDGTFSLPSTFLALRDPSSTKNLLHLASVNRAFRALLVPRLFEGVECVGGHDAVRWELEYLLSLESIHPYIR